MKPKRIILVRHGESLGNAEPNHYATTPDYALDLTEKGQIQAQRAGELIKQVISSEPVRAYVSPWYRTRQTLEGISTVIGGQITRSTEDPRIREQEWGHLRPLIELRRLVKERIEFSPFYYRMPDGESGADVYDRISTFLETMHRDFEKPDFPENALIVTHGMALRVFLMRWFHWTVEHFERVRNPHNAEVVIMELGDDGHYCLVSELRLRSEKAVSS
jgi:broad specificity phosphatase PhoE